MEPTFQSKERCRDISRMVGFPLSHLKNYVVQGKMLKVKMKDSERKTGVFDIFTVLKNKNQY